MKSILVTGANGFIGKALLKTLCQEGFQVRAAVRSEKAMENLANCQKELRLQTLTLINTGELSDKTDWQLALEGIDSVIHCAARAHILKENEKNPLEAFRQINCLATDNLAKQASKAKVQRFIFLSSIGVLGSHSKDQPFSEKSPPGFDSHYGQAKWEAEQLLGKYSEQMEMVIIRPPLVYGRGVKGNFETLTKVINKNLPLPLGSINNRRQFIGIDNLVDFIITCLKHPAAANEVFVIADKETVSTSEFIKSIAFAMQKKQFLIKIPPAVLDLGLKIIGKSKIALQLLSNLEINTYKAREILGWEAPYSMKKQLEKAFNEEVP